MKREMMKLAAAAVAPLVASAASIDQVIVRQQWPWSTDVKVEYRLSGVTSPVDISVAAYNGDTPLASANLDAAITGPRHGITEDGVGTLVIDPVAAFGTSKIAIANFRVKLTLSDSPDNVGEVLYKIFDLTDGSCEDVTRAALLDGAYGSVETDFAKIGDGFSTSLSDVLIWTGVTNNAAYKTTKLVMRKIPAKGMTTTLGRPDTAYNYKAREAQRTVSFTNDYYMGVFELTIAQYNALRAARPSITAVTPKFAEPDTRPMNYMQYKQIRGVTKGVDWPASGHECDNASLIQQLRIHTGYGGFDLPTEAVWEYACRAGTTTDFNCGLDLPSAGNTAFPFLLSIARHSKSGMGSVAYTPDAEHGGTNATVEQGGTQVVGTLKPNAWGLYDMHGNVDEYCLDRYDADNPDQIQTGDDPWGPASGEKYVLRGGTYWNYPNDLHSSSCHPQAGGGRNDDGLRLCLTVY